MNNNRILSKKEVAKLFKQKSQSRISTLLKQGKLVQTEDGKIDFNNPVNKDYLELRKITVPLYTTGVQAVDELINEDSIGASGESKNGLDIELATQKLRGLRIANDMLEIKQAKQRLEIIEMSVLRSVIGSMFSNFFKDLVDLPSLIATELVNIFKTSENPTGDSIEFLTNKLREQIQDCLDKAEKKLLEEYE